MHRDSTVVLKAGLGLIAAAVIAACFSGVPALLRPEAATSRPETAYVPYFFLVYAGVLSATFFVALFHTFRLLGRLGQNDTVSESTVSALKNIKFSAVAIAALMLAGIAGLMALAAGKGEDITGVVAPAGLLSILSATAAVIVGIFQKRIQQALDALHATP